MDEILTVILIIQSVFLFITSGVVVFNFFTVPKLKNKKYNLTKHPYVSVLIPARNEEAVIANIVNCILKQDYPNFELIVLNDNSEDRTLEILNEIQKKDNKLRIMNGESLPENWLGKSWACHQLVQEAKGEIFLFIDSDVTVKENAINSAIYNLQKHKANMLSSFSTQILGSVGEHILVPLLNWIVLQLLPMTLIYSSKNTAFLAANGQFLMIDRESYQIIGGHEAVRHINTEDMNLARNIKKKGLRTVATLGDDTVFCRMYNDFNSAFNGLVRSFYTSWNIKFIFYLPMLLLMLVTFVLPFILVIINQTFIIPIIIITIHRILISISSKQNILLNIILHPIQLSLLFIVGLISFYRAKNQKIIWKGRVVINKI